jgi:hypothetical protein
MDASINKKLKSSLAFSVTLKDKSKLFSVITCARMCLRELPLLISSSGITTRSFNQNRCVYFALDEPIPITNTHFACDESIVCHVGTSELLKVLEHFPSSKPITLQKNSHDGDFISLICGSMLSRIKTTNTEELTALFIQFEYFLEIPKSLIDTIINLRHLLDSQAARFSVFECELYDESKFYALQVGIHGEHGSHIMSMSLQKGKSGFYVVSDTKKTNNHKIFSSSMLIDSTCDLDFLKQLVFRSYNSRNRGQKRVVRMGFEKEKGICKIFDCSGAYHVLAPNCGTGDLETFILPEGFRWLPQFTLFNTVPFTYGDIEISCQSRVS